MKQLHEFKSLLEVFKTFSDEEKCYEYLKQLRWTDGKPTCPKCGSQHKIYLFSNKRTYSCTYCDRQFSIKVGTIFENSKIKLSKWFPAIYLITSRKKGISSVQLGKDLGITQSAAWFMLHRIRKALRQDFFNMIETTAEIDETFIGGKEKNKPTGKRTKKNQGRSTKTRIPIVGILTRRNKEVRAIRVDNTSKEQLHAFILGNIFPDTKIMTDEWTGYKGLDKMYKHSVVKHKNEEYVRGECHTNGIEGFWSLLKRGIIGVYHQMSKKHIEKYVDEFVFRYNTIRLSDCNRFYKALGQVNVRLRYDDLIQG